MDNNVFVSIEDAEDEPVMIVIGLVEFEGETQLRVQAQGFAPSAKGMSEISELFTAIGQDMKDQLGDQFQPSVLAETVKRPRFNPQPRKPGHRP